MHVCVLPYLKVLICTLPITSCGVCLLVVLRNINATELMFEVLGVSKAEPNMEH